MMTSIFNNRYFHGTQYKGLLETVILSGEKVSPREKATIEVRPAVLISRMKGDVWPNWRSRKMNAAFSIAEFLWIMRGSDDLEEIEFYNSKMRAFSDNEKTLHGAYGRRLIKFDQLERVVEKIRKDNSTRQAYAPIYESFDNVIVSKDIPCTQGVQFTMRDNELEVFVTMRSNDVVLGFPYDWATFALMGQYVASLLGVRLGVHSHYATSLHIYESNLSAAKKMLESGERYENLEVENRAFEPFVNSHLTLSDINTFEHIIRNSSSYSDIADLCEEIDSQSPLDPATDLVLPLAAFKIKKMGIELNVALSFAEKIRNALLREMVVSNLREGVGIK